MLWKICTFFVICAVTAIHSPAQTLTTLASFAGINGAYPQAALIQASDGNFYGTTFSGAANGNCTDGCGTVFKITPSGTLTTLYIFCSQLNCVDGANPRAALVQASDGNFYGTTTTGGASGNCLGGCGTVFKMTPQGTLTTLYSFDLSYEPYAALVQASDGNFYGTTSGGGTSNLGTVFKITPSGTLTILHSFGGYDGYLPYGGLVQASDGNFYGTTQLGPGTSLGGTVFKMTPSGTLTTLHSFAGYPADGAGPNAALVQASDDNFYGTTTNGGASDNCAGGCGTVFQITLSGTLTTLHSFNGTDGQQIYSGLVQASDGNFYGTTSSGGASDNCSNGGCGTVFQITPGGGLTTQYSFCVQSNCPDGKKPNGGLVQAGDGNFYGTTAQGGAEAYGTVFRLSGPARSPLQFVPVTPCRVVDTRNPNGPFGGPPIQGGTARSFAVPQGACGIPSSAAAYSFNVTAVPHGSLSYLTIWPTGQSQPVVSTMNSLDGRIKADAAIVPAGRGEAVSVYVTDTSDVVLDINGYFAAPSSQTLQFYPLPPCRLVDTRNSNGPLGGPSLTGGQERDFPLLDSSCVPSGTDVQAYSLNFTVVPKTSAGVAYLTVWPQGQNKPLVSTLNDLTNTIVANAAIVPAGTGGGVATYPSNDTDLVIDINGYFAAPATGGLSFYALTPCRVIDTRKVGNGQPFTGELTIDVHTSPCGPPSTSAGYIFNATVVPTGPLGYLTLWPDGEGKPGVSTLNALDGAITSNMAIVPNNDGVTAAYAPSATQLILDISGYFAP